MSRVPPHGGKRLHNQPRRPTTALDRSRGAGASALRLGLSQLPRLAAPLRSRCDDDGSSIVKDIVIGVTVAGLVAGAEKVAESLVNRWFGSVVSEESGTIEVDVDLLADAVAERLGSRASSDCTECECGDCQCECHGDEAE